MNYWEQYRAGMLKEIHGSIRPFLKASELFSEAMKEAQPAPLDYARKVALAWSEILKELADDHDDDAT